MSHEFIPLFQQETPPKQEDIERQALSMLDRIIENKRPQPPSASELESEQHSLTATETYFKTIAKHEDIMCKLLAKQGIEVAPEKVGRKLFKIQLDEKDLFLEKLPPGYVYRGGAARAILHRKLGIDNFATPRDIDIAFGGSDENKTLSDELAKKFSPEDFRNDHKTELLEESYFEKQDFTINEILATTDGIYLTSQCLLDNARGILRLCEYEKRDSYHGAPYFVNPKLLAKALRFVADKNLEFWNDEIFDFQSIDCFHMALHFDRAMKSGIETAIKYIFELKERGQIPEDIETTSDMLRYLQEELDPGFYFQHVETADLRIYDTFLKEERETLEQLADEYQDYPPAESFSKNKK